MFILATCLILAAGNATGQDMASPVDRVLVEKSARRLSLMSKGVAIKQYPVALGGAPVGAKTRQRDHKTPEGVYILDYRNAHSHYYRSMHISYPNAADRARAQQIGVSTGGDIFLHGITNGFGWVGAAHRKIDWTDGCIAVTDQEMDEIWSLVRDGTAIEIRP
ncbi:MAG: L,D-transpeptidase family protein [Acidobacteria bacterium]|nr:L,D-transpeptidase family protein [Acidobacteriota bacterium]